MNIEINEGLARKVLEVVDAGLVSGMGDPTPGKMCVEAAVNYAMGAPHGDKPACVAPVLRELKIRLNDKNWSSDMARANGLRRLAIAQLGSAGALDEREFVKRVVRSAIQKQVPAALRAAASICKTSHKDKLLTMADLCERDPTRDNALEARKAAAAAYAAAAAAAAAAAYAAAYAADAYADAAAAYAAAAYAAAAYAAAAYAAAAYADDAYADAYAADAYAAAAYAAAAYADDAYADDAYADAYAAAYAADAAARDRSLAAFAEDVVQILIDLKAPGCKYLWLTEGGEAAA